MLTHMHDGGGASGVLLGLLPNQLVDRGGFVEASVDILLVHVGQWRVRRGGCYMAPTEKRKM